ncbi:AfsR/SARP family transcriptional regulator [Streptomyces bluensis]|uniref:AfsR/SARP family transcriptional regulator n=1 Tax=Streptomyces bluensis TaxID=33897 RepID=UPI00331BD271
MTIAFGVLGEIQAHRDGIAVDLGPARQRCVLAALLVDLGRTVPVDGLVDRVWGDRPPQRVKATLYSYLSRLRQALGTAADPPLAGTTSIERRSGGYALVTAPGLVDMHVFRDLAGQARAAATHDDDDDGRAAALFERALGLWRDEPFAGVDTPWFNSLRESLLRELHACRLDRNDVQLRRGHHGALLTELTERHRSHPLDERLAAQYMLALYRSGRTADTLRCFERVRRALAEELGSDPGPELRRLHQSVLAGDPAIDTPGGAPTAVPVAGGEAAPGSPKTRAPVVPRQLPAAPRWFTGRAPELALLDGLLDPHSEQDRAVVISAIDGSGGIGKTWLALHWAHQQQDRFPDGELYANLRGFDPTGEPVPPHTALRGFLGALGTDPSRIPAEPDAQTALYRSLTAGKRMLIVLDDARDTTQVVPLLPGSPTCTVLVTSRSLLTGLSTAHGARSLTLDVLTDSEAHQLLTRHLGTARAGAEPEAVATLLEHCAGLPLAISILAARATTNPDLPLAALAEELHETQTRLDALDTGDITADLRAVFASSYHALDPDSARGFALLGLAPGPDISLSATAGLTALPTARARALLRRLRAAHLVQEHTPGRYRMHDLTRLYAAEQARGNPVGDNDEALLRLVDFYVHTARAGEAILDPHAVPTEAEAPAEGSEPYTPDGPEAAMAWFESEYACVLAAQTSAMTRGWYGRAWQLAWSVDTFLWRRGRIHDHLVVWRSGLLAAERLGDPGARALAHRRVSAAHLRVGEDDTARDHLRRALTLFQDAGDLLNQGHTHQALAQAWQQTGDDRQALHHAERSLRIYRQLKDTVWEANASNTVGWFQARLGAYEQARARCQEALALCREVGYREGEAATLDSLGYTARRCGDLELALEHYGQALALRRLLNDTYEEANALSCIGETHHALGRYGHARDAWQQALTLYQAQQRTPEAENVQEQLDTLHDRG